MVHARVIALAVGGAAVATRRFATRRLTVTASDLAAARLKPVKNGAVAGGEVAASSLWSPHGSLVFVVRRPGWPLCREEALGLSELVRIRGGKQNLVGIVKEVAPTAQAANDTVLGVGAFEREYFEGGSLYLDEARTFYGYLGNKKLLTVGSVLKGLLLPWRTYRALKDVGRRMKEKNIEGNMVGEGLILGGVLVLDKTGRVTYSYPEKTGSPAPVELIEDALAALDE